MQILCLVFCGENIFQTSPLDLATTPPNPDPSGSEVYAILAF
jgi:hypothetical protein